MGQGISTYFLSGIVLGIVYGSIPLLGGLIAFGVAKCGRREETATLATPNVVIPTEIKSELEKRIRVLKSVGFQTREQYLQALRTICNTDPVLKGYNISDTTLGTLL